MKPSIYFYVKPLSNTAMAKIYICERMGSVILSRKSSGITIPTKAWDDKKRTIKGIKDFDPTDALKKLEAISSKYSPTAHLNESDEICFLEFAESRIQNYPNPSTRIKYRGVFKIVKRFISHELQVDKLKISMMKDHSIVARLKSFIQYPSDTNTGSGNGRGRKKVKTIKHYVSVLNNFIAIYNNEVNPSSPIPRISKLNLGREEKPLDRSLTIEEIRKIISFEPVERKKQRLRTPSNENLMMAKYMFLFQYFALGMRVSDMLLLRKKYFSRKGISYIIQKSDRQHLVPSDFKIVEQLKYFYPELYEDCYQEIRVGQIKFGAGDIRDYLIRMRYDQALISQMRLDDVINFRVEHSDNKAVEGLLKFLEECEEKMTTTIAENFFEKLGQQKDDFVFPLLSYEVFKNVKFGKALVLSTDHLEKLHRARTNFNKKLGVLSKEIGGVHLTSHVGRHSYASNLLQADGSLAEISMGMGHSKLTTTETYLRRFPSHIHLSGVKKFKELNKKL